MDIKELHSIFSDYPTVCTDSRNIVPDSVFFALKGDNFDGNKYVRQALIAGCSFAVSDDAANGNIDGCIVVDDVLKTLWDLAEYHRTELNIPVLAITGTNGKTTTKELVAAVLSKRYNVVYTKGNLNNHIGVPLTLLSMNRNTEIAIVEMGANHRGEIAALCAIAHPNHGIITNIGKAHLEGFGSEEGIRQTKGELYDYINSNRGAIFYNQDDRILKQMAENTVGTTLVVYGKTAMGSRTVKGAVLEFSTANPALHVKTNMVGDYNLNNTLAAIAVGMNFNVPPDDISAALADYRPSNNRSQLVETPRNTIIMDAYNANPSSMEAAITNFAALDAPNKLLILGDMLELGKDALTEHKRVVELIKKSGFKKVILTGDMFFQLKELSSFKYFRNRNESEEYIKTLHIESHTILIKASRGIGLEMLAKYF